MEVDEIQQQQVCKFQRIGSNGSATTHNSSNPNNKIATTTTTQKDLVCGWPSSRIVRVSRASGGKDRHSKVLTSKGLRDRRVRLSVTTAIQFYDLQDRLGYDQPSKAVEWLIKAASASIAELPSLDPSFPDAVVDCNHRYHHRKPLTNDRKDTEFEDPNHQQTNNVSVSKSCSSNSETSKGSGLSLSRSENRMKARERAREMAAKKEKEKEKEKESDPITTRVSNGISQNSSFTDLLTGGGGISSAAANNSNPADNTSPPDSRIHWTTPMDYFFNRPPPQLPQFGGENHHPHHHHFSFLHENFSPAGNNGGGGGEGYNLNFSIASASSSGGGFATGFNRGTLQSNLVSVLPQQHVQRFQSSSMVDGSTSTNFPLFMGQAIGSAAAPESFPGTGYDAQRLYDGGRHKEKSKN